MTPSDADTASVPDTFAVYAVAHEEARFTDWLRERAEPNWSNATAHRFTRELGNDDLDDEVFRRYLVQDYTFLETLVGVFGHAVGDAPTMESKAPLVEFLRTLTADENDYFERSFEALGVPEEAHGDPDLTPTTRALEDLLHRAAKKGGYGEALAVLVPAEWIYLEWATAVEEKSPSQFYLAEWIDLHAAEEFETFVEWLREELNREGKAASPRWRRQIERLFRRTVALEVAFFESAYEPDSAVTARGGDERW